MRDAYRESLEFLYSRLNYESLGMPQAPSELRLGRMRRLLRRLGDPQDALRIVHVAGTKGKGSTSAMLAAALTASGVRTGLFCSPHLHRLEERFNIDGHNITSDELVELIESLKPIVAHFDSGAAGSRNEGVTFFEITTAMGLIHFARKGVGAVVLEVGMGGRLDSTNVVHPVVSVVTSISLDHTRLLGSTLGEIATEKAGILKRGRPAISGVRELEPAASIRRIASQRRSRLYELDQDFHEVYLPATLPLVRPHPGRAVIRTWKQDWGAFELPLFGPHQARNAAVALACLDVLNDEGFAVGRNDVLQGFASLQLPARVEVLGESPWLVVDGSHNVASAEALAETLQNCFPPARRTLVFGTTRDKDLSGQLRALLPAFDSVIATRYVENPRSVPTEEIAAAVHSIDGRTCPITLDPSEALALARAITPDSGLICITGSLFLAAETRVLLMGHEPTSANRVLN